MLLEKLTEKGFQQKNYVAWAKGQVAFVSWIALKLISISVLFWLNVDKIKNVIEQLFSPLKHHLSYLTGLFCHQSLSIRIRGSLFWQVHHYLEAKLPHILFSYEYVLCLCCIFEVPTVIHNCLGKPV